MSMTLAEATVSDRPFDWAVDDDEVASDQPQGWPFDDVRPELELDTAER